MPGTSSLKMFGMWNFSRILSDQFTFLVVRSYETTDKLSLNILVEVDSLFDLSSYI